MQAPQNWVYNYMVTTLQTVADLPNLIIQSLTLLVCF